MLPICILLSIKRNIYYMKLFMQNVGEIYIQPLNIVSIKLEKFFKMMKKKIIIIKLLLHIAFSWEKSTEVHRYLLFVLKLLN